MNRILKNIAIWALTSSVLWSGFVIWYSGDFDAAKAKIRDLKSLLNAPLTGI